MKTKILIIEKDTATINAISRLVAALNYQPVILYTWSEFSRSFSKNEVAAVFINVEIPMIKVDKVIDEFYQGDKVDEEENISIFYIYSKDSSELYINAQKLPHTDEVQKPVNIERVYYMLEQNLKLEILPYEELSFHGDLKQFEDFLSGYKDWLKKVGSLLGIN